MGDPMTTTSTLHLPKTLLRMRSLTNTTPNLLLTNKTIILKTLEIQGLSPKSTMRMKIPHHIQAGLMWVKIPQAHGGRMRIDLSIVTKLMTNTITTIIISQSKIQTLDKRGVLRKLTEKTKSTLFNMIHQN